MRDFEKRAARQAGFLRRALRELGFEVVVEPLFDEQYDFNYEDGVEASYSILVAWEFRVTDSRPVYGAAPDVFTFIVDTSGVSAEDECVLQSVGIYDPAN